MPLSMSLLTDVGEKCSCALKCSVISDLPFLSLSFGEARRLKQVTTCFSFALNLLEDCCTWIGAGSQRLLSLQHSVAWTGWGRTSWAAGCGPPHPEPGVVWPLAAVSPGHDPPRRFSFPCRPPDTEASSHIPSRSRVLHPHAVPETGRVINTKSHLIGNLAPRAGRKCPSGAFPGSSVWAPELGARTQVNAVNWSETLE